MSSRMESEIPEGPKVVDALELHAVHPQEVHHRPGGQQGPVERDLLPTLDLGGPGFGIQGHDALAGLQLDPVLLVPITGMNEGVLAIRLAPQVILRERRSIVGRLGLTADHQYRSRCPTLAQLRSTVGGGDARADKQEFDLAIRHRSQPATRASGPRRLPPGRGTWSAQPRSRGRAPRAPRPPTRAPSQPWVRTRCPRA